MTLRRAVLAVLLAGALLGGGGAWATSPLAGAAAALLAPAAPPPSAEDDPAALRQLLDAARAEDQRDANPPPAGSTPDEVLEQTHLRGELVGALEHHLDVLERLPEARQRLADQEETTHNWTAFPAQTPISVLLVDQLREGLETARLQADAANTRGTLVDQQVEDATKRLKLAEVTARQSDEAIAQAQTPAQTDRQTWLRDLARLRARDAAAVIAEGQADKTLTAVESAEQRSRATLLTKQLEAARRVAQFTQADLDAVLDNLDRRRAQLEKRSAQVKSAGLQSRQALALAQRQLAAAKADAEPGDDDSAARVALLERLVALRRLQADNDDLAHDMTRRAIEVDGWERTGWQYRWLLLNSGERDKLNDAVAKIDALIERLENWSQYIEGETLRADGQGNGLASPARQPSDQAALTAEYRAAQRERAEILRGGQQSVGNLLRMLKLWRQDFLSHNADRSIAAVASDWGSAARQGLSAVWSFELFAAEDNLEIDGQRVTAVRSITVGKSLGVILLVLLGSVLSKRGLKIIKRLAVNRLGVERNRADTIARWLHIVLLSMLVMVALYLANIPLTVFAFLGGALAIGVGFGTQVMLKNMISGIMLLVERPLRVGDVIEVGAVVGTVTNISIRSSTVHTADGIEILVPNSTFIENNVTNWTYSNPRVRRSVSIGVDYAAVPKQVESVLLEVANRHTAVLAEPPPCVLLDEFAGEAMQFTLRYWIDYGGGTDGALIASDLRFMIAEALTAAGIPLPQRVVYLRTAAASALPTALQPTEP